MRLFSKACLLYSKVYPESYCCVRYLLATVSPCRTRWIVSSNSGMATPMSSTLEATLLWSAQCIRSSYAPSRVKRNATRSTEDVNQQTNNLALGGLKYCTGCLQRGVDYCCPRSNQTASPSLILTSLTACTKHPRRKEGRNCIPHVYDEPY